MIARFRKAWAALAAGAAVFLTAGVITGSAAVLVVTAIAAVTTSLSVLAAPPNEPKP